MVDGKRTYDVLLRAARSEAGQVPVPDVHDRPGFDAARVLHEVPRPFLLDAPAGLECDDQTAAAVGKGTIDWKKVFAAAKTGGVKNYFVEQDMDMTRTGVAFLKALNV